ncbi:hypothetical protein DZF99_11940, partial [Clavibacter phaseoli]
ALAVAALAAAVAVVLRGGPRLPTTGHEGHSDGARDREASAPGAQPSAASSLAEISSRSK